MSNRYYSKKTNKRHVKLYYSKNLNKSKLSQGPHTRTRQESMALRNKKTEWNVCMAYLVSP